MLARILTLVLPLLALGCGRPADDGGPAAAGAPAAEVARPALPARGVVAAPDGVEIVYEARGEGETTVVLVHCWACDRSFWREQIAPLAETRTVVALDLPGHGESGADREHWSVAGLAADLGSVLATLDLERVVLVGHSMGGPVALIAAAASPRRVIGVVLVDTIHDADLDWTREDADPVIAAFREDFEGANRQFVPLLFPEGADPELVAWVPARANAADRAAMVGLMEDFPNVVQAEILAAAGVPVRAVNAAALGTMIPATAVDTNRVYADYDAAILEGVGHYLMLEKPAEFSALLAAAIEEIERLQPSD
jgi:pimeloyl-ACP methyl ester carboxylesterase